MFLCFDIKLKDFLKVETLVPDIQCLYVTPKDEDGSRYIRYSNVEEDEELQAYVKQLEEDPEVKALYADMQSRYQEALENDEALRTFMEKVTTGLEVMKQEQVKSRQRKLLQKSPRKNSRRRLRRKVLRLVRLRRRTVRPV